MGSTNCNGERFKEFIAEAEDILNSIGRGLVTLGNGVKAGVVDPSVINAIFRSTHSLKGMSGIYDFKDMGNLSHSLEDVLDLLRLGRVSLTGKVLDSIIASHALLVRIVASRGREDLAAEIEGVQESLRCSCRARRPAADGQIDEDLVSALTNYEAHRLRENYQAGRNIYIVTAGFPVTSFDKGYLALISLLKTGSEVIATLPSGKPVRDMLHVDIFIGATCGREDVLGLIGDAAEAEITVLAEPSAPAQPPASPGELETGAVKGHVMLSGANGDTLRRSSGTVRVNIDKLDYILSVISELGILKTGITSLCKRLRKAKSGAAYGVELSRIEKKLECKLTELRDSVIGVRMIPIGQLFSRVETLLVKFSRESGKEIRFFTNGDETQLDKLIVEELADPLMHIIRNVFDHAIEATDVREALGKPAAGTITLNAYQKGNHVVIEVKDDGGGMDADFIKAKAVEKKLVTREYLDGLSRQEILDLIFMPGFTTRDAVSETSGRGVGMDVVKENITRLSGVIDIDTVKGKGTRFVLTIPVTLAIIHAFIVEVSGRRYALPINSVLEIAELERDLIDGRMGTVEVNNREYPYVCLSGFFGMERTDGVPDTCYGIVVGLAKQRLCIIVDSLIKELEIVIKPLSRILKVPSIAGATEMGEDGAILVLDVAGIIEQVFKEKKAFMRT